MEIEEGVQKKGVRKNASMKSLGSCDRIKRRLHAKEGESVFSIKGRKRRSTSVCRRPTEKGIHSTIQITPDITGTLCSKKGWKAKNGARLSLHQPINDKKWIPPTSHYGHIGRSRKEEGVYKAGSEVGI